MKTRYIQIKKRFKTDPFTFDEIKELLSKKYKDKDEKILVLLSELKKKGFISVELDEQDSRKRKYSLIDKSAELIQKEVLDRSDLESLLKEAADLIRTKVDYSFILLLLFYKKLSDKWHNDYEKAFKESVEIYHLTKEEAKKNAEDRTYHDFIIPEEFLWDNIRKNPDKLAEYFSKAMKALSEKNPAYRDVFENFDFAQFVGNRENQEILNQLVELFSINSLEKASPDVLGDSYEWLIRKFAPQKAKEGEVYTPREVIKLLVRILEPKPNESIYDPALGSAGMLIESHNYVEDKYSDDEAKKLFLFGQEANYKTRSIAKMNLYLHGIKNGIPEYGDSLLYPKFKEDGRIQKFDIVIGNPPWNLDGYGEDTIKKGELWKERFNEYGFSPDQSADWLWISHMWASAKDENGRVGVIIDNGALFRGGKEKSIREKFLNDDNIECVILLPEKLFYNTPANGAVMILNKKKRPELKNKIVFINASEEFTKHPEVRRLNSLSDENIEKIVSAFKGSKSEKGFYRIVDLKEIKENDSNLNVSLYVYAEAETVDIDVRKEWEELKSIDKEIGLIEIKIEKYLNDLKYLENK
ncbi:MAG: class I SAM-dependent DNA methyltransferase [Ignavibacteria bacterium]